MIWVGEHLKAPLVPPQPGQGHFALALGVDHSQGRSRVLRHWVQSSGRQRGSRWRCGAALAVGSAARARFWGTAAGPAAAAPSALALFAGRGEGGARCGQGPNYMSYFITFISYYRRLC